MKKNVKRFVSMNGDAGGAGSLADVEEAAALPQESPQRQRLIQAVHPVVR